ncbi:hypothetical protein Poli38472_000489 [Pythium oligandrum]|uniref:Protein kinase domain-containing protein n=1 Tax=Pythium oligandrum TaxID=41045 RepID=A0A8K1CDV1_PYTOL|nr:hypothetical protein Poli38472_000489 [Pythium oligandrum]|eukprot:TMW60447.1 hypothetical protein Poli38472_000489 [Pythium oligandrum]
MAHWPRTSGICRSPLSSEDERDVFEYAQDKENQRPATQPRKASKGLATREVVKKAVSTGSKPKAKPALKRRREDADNTNVRAKRSLATKWKSKRELVRDASERFVDYLGTQLHASTQTRYCEEYGFGQGYMLRMPASWPETRERRAFAEWAELLGFTRSAVHKQLYRISSLNADIVLQELGSHVRAPVQIEPLNDSVVTEEPSSVSLGGADMSTQLSTEEEDVNLQMAKEHFSKLDAQVLEMLSVSEHDRLLSTIRHEEIADAMEDVLARPSLRKDRSRARRVSKLGRISGRTLSLIPLRQSVVPSMIKEVEWEEEDGDEEPASKMELRRSSLGAGWGMESITEEPESVFLSMEPKKQSQWSTGRLVLHTVFNSGFIPSSDLKNAVPLVSKLWRDLGDHAYAWRVADYSASHSEVRTMQQVYQTCPRGHYLSDGAYKEVFKVYSAKQKRLEAVSVMDVRAIESTGNQHVVRQEVAHSLLLSNLVRSRFSPHFVEIYDVFLSRERPQTKHWGSARCRKPVDLVSGARTITDPSVLADDREISTANSLYQYIHMEFCDGGDVEDFIALQQEQLLPLDSVVVPFFFQMVFGVYSARERFQLRHCDIKLLNFFLKDISRKSKKCAVDEALLLRYVVGEETFDVQMPATFSYWVKLADYGTADSNVEHLGKPVTLDQFTTLENTPIEFLLEGDAAQQSFAADTFSLGLCLLHLFTGSAPYEEVLESVRCPPALLQDLKRVWMSNKKNSGFSVLRQVANDDPDDILMHTIYRYLVMLGMPHTNPSEHKQIDRIWSILVKHLRPEESPSSRPSRRAAKMPMKTAKEQFEEDRAKFSLANGNNPTIKRGRDRLSRIPGAQALLQSLVAFNPADRPTMKQTLQHEFFWSLRSSHKTKNRSEHYRIDCYAVDNLPDV